MRQRLVTVIALMFSIAMTSSAHALIGGQPLTGEPDVVRLVFKNGWVCSGAYVDAYTILTAAHCLVADDPTRPIEIDRIETTNDAHLAVIATALIPQPEFHSQQWPAYDVGIVKTTKYEKFESHFQVSSVSPAFRGTALLYGCGRTSANGAARARTTGANSFFRSGAVLFFLGSSSPANNGQGVSVAANDSGGLVADERGEVLGIATTTTAKFSSKYHLPILSTATSIKTPENYSFVLSHLGSTPPQ